LNSGQPVLNLHGNGKKLFNQLNLKHIHISITHDKTYAAAHAIAEKINPYQPIPSAFIKRSPHR
jgi:Phosphopantetheinyl transferase (holo-ACP synthase)